MVQWEMEESREVQLAVCAAQALAALGGKTGVDMQYDTPLRASGGQYNTAAVF